MNPRRLDPCRGTFETYSLPGDEDRGLSRVPLRFRRRRESQGSTRVRGRCLGDPPQKVGDFVKDSRDPLDVVDLIKVRVQI